MRNETQYRECVCVIGSMTQAMRAQSVLATAAIRAEVVKADSAQTGRGCAYGVSFSCSQENNVKIILQGAGIRPRSFYTEERL